MKRILLFLMMLTLTLPVCLAEDTSKVAPSEDYTAAESVSDEGLTAVTADMLVEGEYAISVESSSAMFKIVDCTLTVSGGILTVTLNTGSDSYLYLYPGTPEAAAQADALIEAVPNDAGENCFTFEIPALNQSVDCAAFSRRKEQWYARTLLFEADSLPDEAFAEGLYTVVALEDGKYTAEVTLSGGSGKLTVETPATLTVTDGRITARIVFSSSKYDFVMIDEVQYDNLAAEGNAAFEIPVKGFDYPMPIEADSTAMKPSHLVEYTLLFDSDTLAKTE